ncbi:MAG: hypothetical protein COU06_00570 [Candidatus Harrisonbacteria bacterium CG10_big_fil_rev_8_21_14_0_10_38_8]|uniref:UDP-N-acetylglucosamine--N-acetylmuramyl-(pentapeptide) pyrophosphoryl-undecaprenol N-acetylglucosamine transferase n=1 Tax=Candidatus Harrisonbacteria bacterium CG10_big_fil_rev_8_21_14_0_10_38_8 TaxID=1974582 RepID=A0A2M6WKN3_9BACT|nr:MAG: hypothetical protein COU06_00570 [Candidatus Harrisonbacteria bacterium CG10_big_fil_rev_8_21_14_0_10_38_8]
MNEVRVLLLAGGSGGHFYPLISVAEKLKAKAKELNLVLRLRYFGDPGSYLGLLEDNKVEVSRIVSSKLRRYISIGNVADFFKFFLGFAQSMIKLFFYMPDVVFSKSGPGTLPILLACRWYMIPIVIHESDSVPGAMNRVVGRFASIVELGFTEGSKYFPKAKKINVVGNPIRDEIVTSRSRAESRKNLGVKDEKKIILFIGGSQGAQAINDFILSNSEYLLQNYEIIHQVGVNNYSQYIKEYEFMSKYYTSDIKERYYPYAFLSPSEMADAINASDIVVSRSGSSIFEIAANGKPSILIPLRQSANNHQQENAYIYASSGAGVVIEEENLLRNLFINQVEMIILNKEKYEKMSNSAKSFYQEGAAEKIAEDILALTPLAKV